MSKKCSTCKTIKESCDFYGRKRSIDGLAAECKECAKSRKKRQRKENPRQRATDRRIKNAQNYALKKIILDHYCQGEWKCAKCPYKDWRALSVDHIKGDGAIHRKKIPGTQLYSWLIENNFPEGYQILCMCCQFIKRHENCEWKKPT